MRRWTHRNPSGSKGQSLNRSAVSLPEDPIKAAKILVARIHELEDQLEELQPAEILPCAKCGKAAELRPTGADNFAVYCRGCSQEGPPFPSALAAVRRWNYDNER